MTTISKKDAREHIECIERISDDRVSYFYMMLGSALADALAESRQAHGPAGARDNTSPQHLQDIIKRMSS